MGIKNYNAISTGCLLAGVAAVVVFDRFDGSRTVSLILGAAAGVVGTWMYLYNQIVLTKGATVINDVPLTERTREEAFQWLSESFSLVGEPYRDLPRRQAIEQLMRAASSSKPAGYVITVSDGGIVTIRVMGSSKEESMGEVPENRSVYAPLKWALPN